MQKGRVFPPVTSIRTCSREVAIAVFKHAKEKNYNRASPGRNESISSYVARKMYFPEYVPIINKLDS